MKNVKFVILTLTAVLLSAVHTLASDGLNAIDNKLYTQDTLALEPLTSEEAYQEAKLWFLPDYQENISAGVNDDKDKKPNTPNTCASFNGDGSGRTYLSNPDLSLYSCSGPLSMANKVKCYYGCVCKIAENTCSGYPDTTPKSGNGWSNTSCRKFSVASCSYGATSYKNTCTAIYSLSSCPTNGICAGPDCAGKYSLSSCKTNYTKSGNSCVCATSCSHKVTSKPANSAYTYETCTACGSSMQIQNGWKCVGDYVQSGSGCVPKCTPKTAATGCSYGTESCDDGCGGTTTCCKGCTPLANETSCAYGTESCSNGCGGTRLCCKGCTPKPAATGCSYGTESCSDGCGGTTTCCKECTPLANETGCAYGTQSCSNGCGSTRLCCKACSLPACSSISSKPDNSSYITASCTDCSGTKTVNTGWKCSSGYSQFGSSCIKDKQTCEDYGYYSAEPDGKKCISQFVSELKDFCYSSDCKTCDTGVLCKNGCAKYNMSENTADLYGCSRVCILCNINPVVPEKPSCGSETLITCNGIYYCCEPRFASCYYTTPHNFADGTTTYLCSLHSSMSIQNSGELIEIAP